MVRQGVDRIDTVYAIYGLSVTSESILSAFQFGVKVFNSYAAFDGS
jgi:hypothetical protein